MLSNIAFNVLQLGDVAKKYAQNFEHSRIKTEAKNIKLNNNKPLLQTTVIVSG